MANRIFVISDTHFCHTNILGFKGADGKLIRPEFSSVGEMNEVMIQRWNSIVTPQDKVYHLGDVYMGHQSDAEAILSRLNGKKQLILGNHDCIYGKGNVLQKYFKKIYLWRKFKDMKLMLSHIPLREDQIRGGGINVHGHIHEKDSPPGPYRSVCVEKINYTPVNIEELIP